MEEILNKFAADNTLFTEVDEIMSVVEVVLSGSGRVRIEVHKDYSNSNTPYTVQYFVRETVTLQPSYPSSECGGQPRIFEKPPEDIGVWKPVHYPSVAEQTAENALNRALGWIQESARQA